MSSTSANYFFAISAGGNNPASLTGNYSISATDNGVVTVDSVQEDTGATATLSANQTLTGTIDSTDVNGTSPDRDWYKLTLTANHKYHFTAQGTSGTLDAVAADIKNSTGTTITQVYDNNPAFDFVPGTSGTYFVAVSAGGNNFATKTGNYTIDFTDAGTVSVDTVAESPSTMAILSTGQTATGTVDAADLNGTSPDRDWYKLTLAANHKYHFTAQGTSGTLDAVAADIKTSTGTTITQVYDNNPAFDFVPGTSGTYFVAVSAGGNNFATKTGNYTISETDVGAVQRTNSPPTITAPGTLSSKIGQPLYLANTVSAADADGYVAFYRFTDKSGSGHLILDGSTSATSVTVPYSQIARVGFISSTGGSNQISISAEDNDGAWSADSNITISISGLNTDALLPSLLAELSDHAYSSSPVGYGSFNLLPGAYQGSAVFDDAGFQAVVYGDDSTHPNQIVVAFRGGLFRHSNSPHLKISWRTRHSEQD